MAEITLNKLVVLRSRPCGLRKPLGGYLASREARRYEQTSSLEIKKVSAKKCNLASRVNSLEEYEAEQARIKKLLKQIETSLVVHDHKASGQGGHHWGHVGDLRHVAGNLEELRDFMMGTGEYAK